MSLSTFDALMQVVLNNINKIKNKVNKNFFTPTTP